MYLQVVCFREVVEACKLANFPDISAHALCVPGMAEPVHFFADVLIGSELVIFFGFGIRFGIGVLEAALDALHLIGKLGGQ